MSTKLPHRSENDLKNKWYSMMRVKERSRNNTRVMKPAGFLLAPSGVKKDSIAADTESYIPLSDGTPVSIGKETGKLPGASVGKLKEDEIMPATVESRPFVKAAKHAAVEESGQEIDSSDSKSNYCEGGEVEHEDDFKMSASGVHSMEDDEDDFEPNFVPTHPVVF